MAQHGMLVSFKGGVRTPCPPPLDPHMHTPRGRPRSLALTSLAFYTYLYNLDQLSLKLCSWYKWVGYAVFMHFLLFSPNILFVFYFSDLPSVKQNEGQPLFNLKNGQFNYFLL